MLCTQVPFHADNLLATVFKPSDAFVHAASLNQVEVVKKWFDLCLPLLDSQSSDLPTDWRLPCLSGSLVTTT